MKPMKIGKFVVAAAALSIFGSAHAQFDPAVFAKWGSEPVIKFTLVQTYEGERAVTTSGAARANVKDRYEIEFRWNQFESRLIGEPIFKNYPTVTSKLRNSSKECPTPVLASDFEHATVKSVAQGDGAVLLVTLRTDYPAAREPQMCSDASSKQVAARSEEQPVMIAPPGIAVFGLKTGQMPGISVDGDTVTIVEDGFTNVWTISKG